MQISEYIEKARSTAIYNGPFNYPSHGLVGEIGELIDKLTLPDVDKEEIIKEVGDVLWYVVNILEDAGMSLLNLAYLLSDQNRPPSNFSDLGPSIIYKGDYRSMLVKLSIYAGRINEVAKKMIRDSDGIMPESKVPVVQDSICHIIICLYDICSELDINMDDVAQGNIDKLFSRKARGRLQGSGDNR